jgi:SMODS-associated and fused to various effectors sensor domain
MSDVTLNNLTVLRIWVKSGGRCAYAGCNENLLDDELTQYKAKTGYLAHIVGEKPGGPRGHPTRSEELKADPENIMLLCAKHHKMVDVDQVEEHSEELLLRYKRDHETRIELQTGIHPSKRTHVVLFGTGIQERRGLVNFEQAHQAIMPERYPATARGIRIDLNEVGVSPTDDGYWELATKLIKRKAAAVHEKEDVTGIEINHLSVFGLAHIPLLIYFGRAVGDVVPADVYQRHRSPADWKWRAMTSQGFNYTLITPEEADTECNVAVVLSLSGQVHREEVERVLGKTLPTYELTIANPGREYLQAQEQLELFTREWRELMTRIRATHGPECEVHLFPAVPVSVAIEMGRAMLPAADPVMHLYNLEKTDAQSSHFKFALTLHRELVAPL